MATATRTTRLKKFTKHLKTVDSDQRKMVINTKLD